MSRMNVVEKEREEGNERTTVKKEERRFGGEKGYVHTNSPNLLLSPTKQIPILSSLANALWRPHFLARYLTWVLVSGGGCGGWV